MTELTKSKVQYTVRHPGKAHNDWAYEKQSTVYS